MEHTTRQKIDKKIKLLLESKKTYIKLTKQMFEADSGRLFELDFFFKGVVQRSLSLISGFCLLLEKRNVVSAFSLIRLHLDSLLQSYGAFLVEDPHNFALQKMQGERTQKIKDKSGNNMKDWYLRETFFSDENNKEFKRLEKVYQETSGFIHFSEKHIFSGGESVKDGEYNMVISETIDVGLEDEYIAVDCMVTITAGILKYLYSWIATKEKGGKEREKQEMED